MRILYGCLFRQDRYLSSASLSGNHISDPVNKNHEKEAYHHNDGYYKVPNGGWWPDSPIKKRICPSSSAIHISKLPCELSVYTWAEYTIPCENDKGQKHVEYNSKEHKQHQADRDLDSVKDNINEHHEERNAMHRHIDPHHNSWHSIICRVENRPEYNRR